MKGEKEMFERANAAVFLQRCIGGSRYRKKYTGSHAQLEKAAADATTDIISVFLQHNLALEILEKHRLLPELDAARERMRLKHSKAAKVARPMLRALGGA